MDKATAEKIGKVRSYFPALYCTVYPMLAEIARRNGYALTVHGSMGRDFDLVAIPWIDNPSTPYELIEALRNGSYSVYQISEMPTKKPHGRLAWNLELGSGAYLDVSIMSTETLATPEPATPTAQTLEDVKLLDELIVDWNEGWISEFTHALDRIKLLLGVTE